MRTGRPPSRTPAAQRKRRLSPSSVANAAMGIGYANFKDRVAATAGNGRARTYAKVWAALRELEAEGRSMPEEPLAKRGRRATARKKSLPGAQGGQGRGCA